MRPYLASDYAALVGWYEARGLVPPPPDALPRTGLIVPGIAAGFLYRTDSLFCLLDGFISNPEAPMRDRAAALEAIGSGLLRRAEGGRAICHSKTHGMTQLAMRLGMKPVRSHLLLEA